MNSSDFRRIAREKLSGKWGTVVFITFCFGIIDLLLNFVNNATEKTALGPLFSILIAIINVPLIFGLTSSFVRFFNGETVNAFDFLTVGFQNFLKSVEIRLRILVKLIVPIIILIIAFVIFAVSSGISFYSAAKLSVGSTNTNAIFASSGLAIFIGFILVVIGSIFYTTKSYYYKLANIIAIENPNITPKEAVELSKKYMTNNRWKLFVLELSFIGWAILTVFTFGIGLLWLIPYTQIATVAFSKHVCNNDEVEVQPTIENAEEQ